MGGESNHDETLMTSLSGQIPPEASNVDLTMCGLLVDQSETLAELYRDQGNWNDVKEIWFDDRISDRSTRSSSQKIFRILTNRLKNAPTTLPNASDLPSIFNACVTPQAKAQVLYFYLIEDDGIVRYVVDEYARRLESRPEKLDFSNQALDSVFDRLVFSDGTPWEYAESTTERWYEGFRSVMRNIGAIQSQREVVGRPPDIGDIPLRVALGYSYSSGTDEWVDEPNGLLYLYQPQSRWEELYDRAVESGPWEYIDVRGSLHLRPADGDPFGWIDEGGLH